EERVQGRDPLKKLLNENPEMFIQLDKELREKLGIPFRNGGDLDTQAFEEVGELAPATKNGRGK
ncbi:MAG: hypothetical protein H7X80_10040, partial [bacterium]|nr:hypothetical protein [Candidatus Kapabacteria bacterium]